jgi:hypothetical protein
MATTELPFVKHFTEQSRATNAVLWSWIVAVKLTWLGTV